MTIAKALSNRHFFYRGARRGYTLCALPNMECTSGVICQFPFGTAQTIQSPTSNLQICNSI